MTAFRPHTVKGIDSFLVAENVHPDRLHMHISEIGPGTRAHAPHAPHAPHAHAGVEAFYIFEGQGSLETGGESYPLKANESIVLDATKEHGLVNTGSGVLRYLVVIARDGLG